MLGFLFACSTSDRQFVGADELGPGVQQATEPVLPDPRIGSGPDSGVSAEQLPLDTPLEAAEGALGAECAIDAGCTSGFCVAGRCCDQACDGVCEACSESGRCDAAPEDDSRCPVLDCGVSSTLCAELPEQQESARCASHGTCKSACDPLRIAVDAECEEVAEGLAGQCSPDGACIDPRSALGAACDSDLDCAAGACTDGVCCEEACGADCESCDSSGTCVADPPESGCSEGRQCFGRGQCLGPLGSACNGDGECGSGNCEPSAVGGSVCCASACQVGFVCNANGDCVSPESDLGSACANNADCLGGRCFDGRCCDVACAGACERCNAPGQEGRCVAEVAGLRDPQCPAGLECAGRECKQPLGASCALDGECSSGTCGQALVGTGEICCERVCPAGQRCGAAGNCVDAPRPDGGACSVGSDCSSGSCVAGRCCESACNGVCQACSGLGDCNINPGNDGRCPVVDCPQSNTVCVSYPGDLTTNLCAAFGSCRNSQDECSPSFAAANTLCENVAPGVRGRCDGQGNCLDPRVGVGSACNEDTQCSSGNCEARVGGGANVCCDSVCTGICEACSGGGVCGFSDTGRCPAGQECASRTSCEAQSVPVGGGCANGQSCSDPGSACINGVCVGLCRMASATAADGSRLDQCLLGQ